MKPATFPPRRVSTAHNLCAVPGCVSRYDIDNDLSFHKFPKQGVCSVKIKNNLDNLEKQVDKLTAWKEALKIKSFNSSSRVCSLHFSKEDYILPEYPCKKKNLKRSAVPWLNLSGSNKEKKKEKIALERNIKRQQRASASSSSVPCQSNWSHENVGSIRPVLLDSDTSTSTISSVKNHFLSRVDDTDLSNVPDKNDDDVSKGGNKMSLVPLETLTSPSCVAEIRGKEAEVQTDFVTPRFSFKNDEELSCVTGLESFEILNLLVKLVEQVLTKKKNDLVTKVSLRDQIILTYMKFKNKVSHNLTAILFNCDLPQKSQQICQSISEILNKHLLAEKIRQPSKKEVMKSISIFALNGEQDDVLKKTNLVTTLV